MDTDPQLVFIVWLLSHKRKKKKSTYFILTKFSPSIRLELRVVSKADVMMILYQPDIMAFGVLLNYLNMEIDLCFLIQAYS